MRLVKIVIILFVSILSTIIILGFSAAYFYGDKIQDIALEELNKKLKAEVDVKTIEISFFENLPYVSIILDDVFIKSVKEFNSSSFRNSNTDTLLFAQKLTLNFNIYKAIKNVFDLKKLTVSKGKINLFIDKSGKANYQLWDEGTDKESSKFNLNLNSIIIDDIDLSYFDKETNIESRSHINKFKISGNLDSENINSNISLDTRINNFFINRTQYISNQNINSHIQFTYDNEMILVKSGELKTNKLGFTFKGLFLRSTNELKDAVIAGNNLNLDELFLIIPANVLSSDYKKDLSGNLSFILSINGKIGNNFNPVINASFSIKDGIVRYNDIDKIITNISFEGKYSGELDFKTDKSSLLINKLKIGLINDKTIDGNLSLSNLKSPQIKGDLNINMGLDIISQFNILDKRDTLSGNISGNIRFDGLSTDYNKLKTNNLLWTGNIYVSKVNYGNKNSEPDLTLSSGNLLLKDKDIEIKDADINYTKNKYLINGIIHEPLVDILNNQPLKITSDIVANKIIISNNDSTKDDEFSISDRLDLNAQIKIQHFVYDRIEVSDISTNIIYKNKAIELSELEFKAINGLVKSDLKISESYNKSINITGVSDLYDIDIHEFFYSFRSFGQTFIQARHITGDLSGRIHFNTNWTPQLDIIEKDILIESSVEVTNGELFDFRPMIELSNYLRVPDLEHISFSKLRNDIVIQNQQVFIPLMEINSTALNLNISGIHGFDQNISYDITLLLSEIISKRFKSNKPDEWEEYTDESLQTRIYLKAEGNVDDFEIKYDFEKTKEKKKENRKEEKKELKAVLHKELGLFKKDSVELKKVIKEKEKVKKKKVQIIWDEDESDEENEDPD